MKYISSLLNISSEHFLNCTNRKVFTIVVLCIFVNINLNIINAGYKIEKKKLNDINSITVRQTAFFIYNNSINLVNPIKNSNIIRLQEKEVIEGSIRLASMQIKLIDNILDTLFLLMSKRRQETHKKTIDKKKKKASKYKITYGFTKYLLERINSTFIQAREITKIIKKAYYIEIKQKRENTIVKEKDNLVKNKWGENPHRARDGATQGIISKLKINTNIKENKGIKNLSSLFFILGG